MHGAGLIFWSGTKGTFGTSMERGFRMVWIGCAHHHREPIFSLFSMYFPELVPLYALVLVVGWKCRKVELFVL